MVAVGDPQVRWRSDVHTPEYGHRTCRCPAAAELLYKVWRNKGDRLITGWIGRIADFVDGVDDGVPSGHGMLGVVRQVLMKQGQP